MHVTSEVVDVSTDTSNQGQMENDPQSCSALPSACEVPIFLSFLLVSHPQSPHTFSAPQRELDLCIHLPHKRALTHDKSKI